jgi:hypothetical protein
MTAQSAPAAFSEALPENPPGSPPAGPRARPESRGPANGGGCYDPRFERPDLVEDDYDRFRNQPRGW